MSETTYSSTRRRILRGGIATAAATATVVAAVVTPASAAAVTLTLSSAFGPGTSDPATKPVQAVTITASHATTAWLSGAPTTLKAALSVATCPLNGSLLTDNVGAATAAGATTIISTGVTATKVTNNKAMVGLPTNVLLGANGVAQKYNVCIYGGATTADLTLGTASYTVGAPATLTGISPESGMTVGGNQITVTGTNFPTTATAISATLGGVPLTGITSPTTTSFKATVPAGKPGDATLAVTTSAGTVTSAAAASPFYYAYSNGIEISPNTAAGPVAPATSAIVYVDVMGSGFTDLSFDPAGGIGSTAAAALAADRTDSQVFLVNGDYTPGATDYTVGPVAQCGSVAVISDRELICGMDLGYGLNPTTGASASGPVPDGTYTLTVVSNADFGLAPADYTKTALTSGATFTVAPY
ncbi:IPT/TIG domain-containing protein [Actinoplanes flavus]|uniref:IPT/TIG domain-containing protein n=1 Tax=Actinoplanes flavus TaxID=2820290 RepID=A0ABS3UU68_9ACTN|nr:IPT/TIG domain-containing protein [Actinoplanes flavus]MBO3742114.1 IPT/TIG domain-containing protein [Actinoplanes flavus]